MWKIYSTSVECRFPMCLHSIFFIWKTNKTENKQKQLIIAGAKILRITEIRCQIKNIKNCSCNVMERQTQEFKREIKIMKLIVYHIAGSHPQKCCIYLALLIKNILFKVMCKCWSWSCHSSVLPFQKDPLKWHLKVIFCSLSQVSLAPQWFWF